MYLEVMFGELRTRYSLSIHLDGILYHTPHTSPYFPLFPTDVEIIYKYVYINVDTV